MYVFRKKDPNLEAGLQNTVTYKEPGDVAADPNTEVTLDMHFF